MTKQNTCCVVTLEHCLHVGWDDRRRLQPHSFSAHVFLIYQPLSVGFWLMPLSRLASLASRLLVQRCSGHVCGHRGCRKADIADFGQRFNWMQSKLAGTGSWTDRHEGFFIFLSLNVSHPFLLSGSQTADLPAACKIIWHRPLCTPSFTERVSCLLSQHFRSPVGNIWLLTLNYILTWNSASLPFDSETPENNGLFRQETTSVQLFKADSFQVELVC